MKKPLNLLIAEDSQNDAEIVIQELRRAGFNPKWIRVETEPDFLAELKKSPDIILSDYSMPKFNGLRAAQLAKESGLDIPFILISGTVGEDAAVEAMKRGATDYLLKDRITRLGMAVEQALEQKRLRAERKQVELSLNLFRMLVDRSNDGIEVIDPETARFLDINETTCRQVGYSRDELLSMTVMDLDNNALDPGKWPEIVEKIRRADFKIFEGTHRRKDGSVFPIEVNARFVTLGRDYLIASVRDITGRKRAEEALQESEERFRQTQKMEVIGQLAGGVAHDFNNILAVIGMHSELLESSGGLSAAQLGFADEINVAVQRAAALTRQLLLFSRREVFQPCDLDLSKSITETAKMLRRILGENIEMQLKLASLPMLIHADAGMMDQVLLNLAVNARDAMPGGGRLIIKTCSVEFDEIAAAHSAQVRAGSFVCLSVSDSGCGIPPENIPKIFEPFFTTKDVGKGTGLGLATVFGIVQQHQGWINVESEVGRGTTFRIYLPRLAKSAGRKSAQRAFAVRYGGNETILLAEDDPSLRTSLRIALTRLGYQVLEAPTGVKAMEVWNEHRDQIRLLLTDMMMPGETTGDALAQDILKENPKLKVIYMSGYSAEVASKSFPLKEGVNFLAKPFPAAKLAQTIRESLDAM